MSKRKRDAKSTYLREQRDKALYRVYTSAIREHHFNSFTEACNWVRKQAAPSFFSSPEFCQIIVSRLLRGKDCGLKGARLAKYTELRKLYCEYREMPEYADKPMIDICNIIVDLPAPEFYLERRVVSSILQEQKKKERERFIREWVTRD